MKTICSLAIFLAANFGLYAQSANGSATTAPVQTDQSDVPAPTAYHVTERGANHKVWQSETFEKRADGTIVPHVHSYTELASGLNYKDANGNWQDAVEEIDAQPDGSAAATQGQHQAYFPADIYSGMVRLVTADGQQLQSQPAALAYDDGNQTVIIAVLTNSTGALLGNNQAIYANAFSGADADVLYTYKKGGFEQDIVLHRALPTPDSLGLNPETARLQVLTEFFNPPTPDEQTTGGDAETGLTDTTLEFGSTAFTHGKAFMMGHGTAKSKREAQIPVFKHWLKADGRTFLIESVPYHRVTSQLQALPTQSRASSSEKSALYARRASGHYDLPATHLLAANSGKKVQFAKADAFESDGLVLDYATVSTGATNYTFQGDTTYYISGGGLFHGTVTFEGGTVIKIGNAGGIQIASTAIINCKTSPYRPAIFTSTNDNSVGDAFGSGSPAFGDLSGCVSFLSTNVTLHDMRFCYARFPIDENEGFVAGNLDVWNCQFINTDMAILCWNLGLHNVLIARSTNQDAAVDFCGPNLTGENVTADGGNSFVEADYSPTATVALTNCLVTRQSLISSDGYTFSPATNATAWIPTVTVPVYQVVGAGNYYLTNGSPYRNAGSTNISPTLLAELAQKTTYPPLLYSNVTISMPTNFAQQVPRDTNASPDIGYHYDPLDYIFGNVSVATNISFTAGTAVGWFDSSGFGMKLSDGVQVSYNGTATAPCVFALYSTVQEGNDPAWTGYNWMWFGMAATGSDQTPSTSALISPVFTHFYSLAQTHLFLRDYSAVLRMWADNCEFYTGGDEGYGLGLCMTNCLFDRVYFAAQAMCCAQIFLQNCTMQGGVLYDSHSGSWPVTVTNCAFDGTTLTMDSTATTCDYNAFVISSNRLPVLGAHDVTVTNFNWQSSWLGNYYLPTNSALIDAGSTTADQLGLYHFTTQTNQIKEANSTVDIGYHYVATDGLGNPLDSDGDGVPDYIEDANGDGIYDTGDPGDWQNPLGIKVLICRPSIGSPLP